MVPRAQIIGTGSSTPKRILSNKDLEKIVDTSDDWITRRTGIKERRIAAIEDGESTTSMATQASLKSMEMAGISPENLDMIVVGTVTGDRNFPSVGCMIQEAIKAKNATAFDVSAGCSGFLYALEIANNAIRTGTCNTALVVGVERLSAILNWKDRSTCVLLGDGAGAVVVTSTKEQDGILSTHLKSDGSFWELLYSEDGNNYLPEMLHYIAQKPFRLIMDGHRLFKKAVDCLTSIARKALQHNSLSIEKIKLLVPHQANLRIIQAMANNLKIPIEKVYTNIQKYGNTSSASIPIALDEANRNSLLKKGDHVLLVSFGAGLTWGSSIVRWSI
jgi:3-oxoacyl-[acyl-carrier-protein] synthase-3